MRQTCLARWGLAAGVLALVSSCTGLKYATDEKPLFTDFTVEWIHAPVEDKKAAQRELESLVKPAPNNSIFGMRPTVALHNAIKKPEKPKGLKNLLRNKIGSEPVYLADVPVADINAAMENRMENRGYFDAVSSWTTERKGKKVTVTFHVAPGTPHRMRNITYQGDTSLVGREIARSQQKSPLVGGQLYDLGRLKEERRRVAVQVRNRGWYKLRDNDLEFVADTSPGNFELDLQLRLKATATEEVRRRYFIGEVYIHGDRDPLLAPNDTVAVDSLRHYINYLDCYRPSTIARGVFLRPGRHYSAHTEENTQRYLTSFGVFRNVEVKFTEDSAGTGLLKADVMAYPQKRWTLFTEFNTIAKSNNFVGPGIRAGFKDRDLFRGAETFTADLNGRFDTQVAGAQKGTNAYEIGIKTALQIPRIVPFNALRTARASVPTTRIELGYGLYRRINLYGIESFNTSLNYNWRQGQRIWHQISFPDISYNKLYYSSGAFDAYLQENPAIQRSFRQQYIIGTGYNFTISSRHRNPLQGWVMASMGIDESGNLLSGLMRLGGQRPEEGYKLFGNVFSQYVRFRPEVRYYQPLPRGNQWANRLMVDIGLPYGNSTVLPYVKQFYSGGTNSLRAFRARTVGPGSYTGADGSDLVVDQTGDIKFEVNSEYRFTIAGYFKGAVFAEAGNIWLVNPDPQRPGAVFEWSKAVSELAMGAGFGLRFDPQVIVVRLDLATPLRNPALPTGDRWLFDKLRPRIFDNIVFNIAIGYPF